MKTPSVAAEQGANEVSAGRTGDHLGTVVVFFPVTLLFGVSKFLFTALALGVVVSLLASYFVALSVVPLYCAKALRGIAHHTESSGPSASWGNEVPRVVQREIRTDAGGLRSVGAKGVRQPKADRVGFPGNVCYSASHYIRLSAFPSFREPTPVNSSSTSKLPPERASS